MDGFRTALFFAALIIPTSAFAAPPGDPVWSWLPGGPADCRPENCPARPGGATLTAPPSVRRSLSLSRWWTESPRSLLALAATTDANAEPLGKRVHSERAAAMHPDTGATFWIDAVEAELNSPKPSREWLSRVRSSGVLEGHLKGSAGARLGIELALTGMISPESAKDALDGPDRESACRAIESSVGSSKPAAELANLHHGYCSDVEIESLATKHGIAPSDAMKLLRADRLYGMVRFRAAEAELAGLSEKLPEDLRCRAEFRRGRTVYRLRRRDDAMEHFKNVVESCADYPDVRVRSLYAIGDRAFDTGRLDDSKAAFSAILTDYPDRSHADDAIMYLGRIARSSGDTKAEKELLELALTKYRSGDMLHEIVWEHLEPLVRTDAHADYLKQLAELDLPERDDEYFSQGRLEYFAGRAQLASGDKSAALETWASVVQKYPFSFYGYLSLMRSRKLGAKVEIEAPAEVAEWVDRGWYRSAPVRLLNAGLFAEAADLATVEPAEDDASKWRKAALLHVAGRPWASHNIVRRSIGGRPWTEPQTGRLGRWHIAWPQPFGDAIESAAAAEDAQNPEQEVRPALPSAIMREESSFIEDIESYAGALGLMQLMPRTALAHDNDIEGDATPPRLKTAKVNVRVGVDHLHWLAKRFDGHPVLMVSAYNAGAGATGKWLRRQPNEEIALFVEDIPYLQTRNYTKRVIGSYLAYQWLRQIDADDRVLRPADKP